MPFPMPRLILLIIILYPIMSLAQEAMPLVPVSWGQTSPYDRACPEVDGKPTAPGCVALAIAHAMSVYRYPAAPEGSVAYTTPTHHLSVTADFSSSSIPWDAVIGGDETSVASFLYLCAAASNMDFCPNTSTTPAANELWALAQHFGYDTDMTFHSRECYSHDAWHEMIRTELSHGRPVIMNATDRSYGAHAFVIDGYKTDSDPHGGGTAYPLYESSSIPSALYHIVWGWGGNEDGYYDIDNLLTSHYTFDQNQRVLISIMPDDKQRTVECRLEASLSLSDTLPVAAEMLSLRLSVYNRALNDYSGAYTLHLVSPDGTTRQIGYRQYMYDIKTNYLAQSTFTFKAPETPGEYRLIVRTEPFTSFSKYDVAVSGDVSFRVLDNETTITLPDNDSRGSGTEPLYNLSGQRVTSSYKGIVIRGKRKTIR